MGLVSNSIALARVVVDEGDGDEGDGDEGDEEDHQRKLTQGQEQRMLKMRTRYLELDADGTEGRGKGVVKPFIPLSAPEKAFEREQREQGMNGRVTLWSFGGVVEIPSISAEGEGRLWYQKSIDYGNGQLEYCGTGIASVFGPADCECERQPRVKRHGDDGKLMFGPDEPRMGTFSAIVEGGWVYLYGDRSSDGKIVLARVRMECVDDKNELFYYCRPRRRTSSGAAEGPAGADAGEAEEEEEGDGEDGDDKGQWLKGKSHSATPIIHSMRQGAIVRSPLFGSDRPFLFIGTSKWADSRVYMGAEKRLEGKGASGER